jgi:ATP synthase F1 delta subunit
VSAEKIAGRYAVALLNLSSGQIAEQDKIIHDLGEIATLYQNLSIKHIIASPIVSRELLGEVFASIVQQLKSSDLLKNFIRTLIENKRTSILPEIESSFRSLVQKSRGIVDARVTTAVALQETDRKEIQAKLESSLKRKVNLAEKIDSGILGGFVIHVENNVLDMSLKTKLENMTKFAVS